MKPAPLPTLDHIRQSLAMYDEQRVRRDVRIYFEDYVGRRPRGRPRGDHRIVRRFRRLVEQGAGDWFPGLSDTWAPEWCACHWIPLLPDQVDACVDRVAQQVTAVHRFYRALVNEATLPLDAGDPKAAQSLGARIIDQVVEATGCNDAWYYEASRALELVLWWRGVDPHPFKDALLEQVSTSFESWCAPTPAAVEAVTDAYAQLLDRSGDES